MLDIWCPFLSISTRGYHQGPWINIKILSYQYRKSHCGDKTVVRSSYLHNGISYTGKMSSLYWFRPLGSYDNWHDTTIYRQFSAAPFSWLHNRLLTELMSPTSRLEVNYGISSQDLHGKWEVIHVTFEIVTYSDLRIDRKWKYWVLRKTQNTTSTPFGRATEFADAFSSLHWGVLACTGHVNIIIGHVNVHIGACPAEEVLSKCCKNRILQVMHIFMSMFSKSVVRKRVF